MTLSNGNIFDVTGPFCGNSTVNSSHEGQWRGSLMGFYLCLNKRLSKQSGRRWIETPSRSLWRHCNDQQLTSKTLADVNSLINGKYVDNYVKHKWNVTKAPIKRFHKNTLRISLTCALVKIRKKSLCFYNIHISSANYHDTKKASCKILMRPKYFIT